MEWSNKIKILNLPFIVNGEAKLLDSILTDNCAFLPFEKTTVPVNSIGVVDGNDKVSLG